MVVDQIEIIDQLVDERTDLIWDQDGKTVLKVRKAQWMPLHKDAVRRGDQWYFVIDRYPLTPHGWVIK